MKFQIAHEFPITREEFWRNLFDPAYDAYIEKDLEFRERKVLEFIDNDKEVRRRVYHLPKRTWPAIIDKVFGDGFGFTEESVWVKGSDCMQWKSIPNRMAERIRSVGVLTVADAGGGKIRRTVEGEIVVKIFGVGGVVESLVLKAIEENYVRAAASLHRWLEKKRNAG